MAALRQRLVAVVSDVRRRRAGLDAVRAPFPLGSVAGAFGEPLVQTWAISQDAAYQYQPPKGSGSGSWSPVAHFTSHFKARQISVGRDGTVVVLDTRGNLHALSQPTPAALSLSHPATRFAALGGAGNDPGGALELFALDDQGIIYHCWQSYHDRFTARIEHWLDQGYGECLLARPEYKSLVENAMRYFDRQRYHLGEFVVMPNHVHAIVTPLPGFGLSEILHSWKSFTSNQINRLAGRIGAFWQKESFDQIIRSPAHLERVIIYILGNPKFLAMRQDGASTAETASSGLQRQDAAATEKTSRP